MPPKPRLLEPFQIKSVSPIRMTSREERKKILEKAFLNVFAIPARDVLIDLLTDSGTGAMSERQWSALARGDESYAGAESFFRFEEAARQATGLPHIIPAHQGRGAEKIIFEAFRQRGKSHVASNSLFDTTRANAAIAGFQTYDFPETSAPAPASRATAAFRGNVDLENLEGFLKQAPDAIFVMTITNNSAGGQPVSMENMRQARRLCAKYQTPMILDACRFAENSYLIKMREKGFQGKTPGEIAREAFSLCDLAFVSAKKDGLSHTGAFIALKDEALSQSLKSLLIPYEGFPTYGGLAGRDLEAIAEGLKEALDEDYLHYRISSVARLHSQLEAAGVPLISPAGGHGVYIDAAKALPHIPKSHFPGQALSAGLYEFSGIRACEIGSVMLGGAEAPRDAKAPRDAEARRAAAKKPAPAATPAAAAPAADEKPGARRPSSPERLHSQELLRLALPRRLYPLSSLDYVADSIACFMKEEAPKLRGVRFLYEPERLRHFTAHFEWL